MKKITIGIVAHVDAGKTTLSEAILYNTGIIRTLGRVDHKNTMLDSFEAEQERGITIFSKQAHFKVNDCDITLLDTPGHVDFATETERTLAVLDYCIMVIGGNEAVTGHTRTLWKLLSHYNIPTFIFINKMDMPGTDKEAIIADIREKLSKDAICFDGDFMMNSDIVEQIALSDEGLMERYLLGMNPTKEEISNQIAKRKIFPIYSGSALKLMGVNELLLGIAEYTIMPQYGDRFGGIVYKITRDNKGIRLAHLKVTGGSLKVKDIIATAQKNGNESDDDTTNDTSISEKVNQIRVYQGEKYETVNEAKAGDVCTVVGIDNVLAGEGLGEQKSLGSYILTAVLNYRIKILSNVSPRLVYPQIKALEEEDPQLSISWNERFEEINVKLMGQVQTEILKDMIKDRLDIDVEFDQGSIVYRETIEDVVEGVGHFEPLRHYAEVHVLIEPLGEGEGIQIATDVSEDVLDKNWQRLIVTHLNEKRHIGVLTGSQLTDVKITLINGKAHNKHTEGGDFRQATYRAVRQGLMQASNVLLEPFYDFTLEVPALNVGRALSDLDGMKASFSQPEIENDIAIIVGKAPVVLINGYDVELRAYTKGQGRITFEYGGYGRCHNPEEVIAKRNYNPQEDMRNPTGSVFCAHGAGYIVPWNEVFDHMHLEARKMNTTVNEERLVPIHREDKESFTKKYEHISYSDNKELQDIFARTYGESKRLKYKEAVVYEAPKKKTKTYESKSYDNLKEKPEKIKEYLLVDGYNVIHANDELSKLIDINVASARDSLMDVLVNYKGFHDYDVILVFDAYKVAGNVGEVIKYNNINVVYTKEAETADRYIERTAHEMAKKYKVTVVTSDGAEQVIIMGAGCIRMSSREFWDDVKRTNSAITGTLDEKRIKNERNYPFEHLKKIDIGNNN